MLQEITALLPTLNEFNEKQQEIQKIWLEQYGINVMGKLRFFIDRGNILNGYARCAKCGQWLGKINLLQPSSLCSCTHTDNTTINGNFLYQTNQMLTTLIDIWKKRTNITIIARQTFVIDTNYFVGSAVLPNGEKINNVDYLHPEEFERYKNECKVQEQKVLTQSITEESVAKYLQSHFKLQENNIILQYQQPNYLFKWDCYIPKFDRYIEIQGNQHLERSAIETQEEDIDEIFLWQLIKDMIKFKLSNKRTTYIIGCDAVQINMNKKVENIFIFLDKIKITNPDLVMKLIKKAQYMKYISNAKQYDVHEFIDGMKIYLDKMYLSNKNVYSNIYQMV